MVLLYCSGPKNSKKVKFAAPIIMIVEIGLQSIFWTKLGSNHDLVPIQTKVQFFAVGGFGKAQKMINVIYEQSLINVIS